MSDREPFSVPLTTDFMLTQPVTSAGLNEQDAIELTCDIVANSRDLYAFKVQGDSMLDALVNDGDVVIIQRQSQAKNGDLVAVRLDESRTTLKHYYRENGHVRLQPANPTLESVRVKPNRVQVEGKVMAIIRQVN
jgi:repressor LexA